MSEKTAPSRVARIKGMWEGGEGWKGEGRLEETRTIIIFEDRADKDYHDHES